VTVVTARCMQK